MHITRQITHAGESPFAGITFKTVDVEICARDVQNRVCLTDIEVPAHWSHEAAETFVRYYIRRAGIPAAVIKVREENMPEWLWRSVPDTAALMGMTTAERTTHETSVRQVFTRMAGMWTYWGWRGGYFETEEDARAFHDESCALLARQVMAPNSPQWFNAGLHWAYGMTGPAQGHFHGELEDGRLRRSVNAYERPQLSACFIHGVRDELVNEGGIMHLFEREVRAFKYGSGTGVNMSPIRAVGETLSSGGTTTGLKRFLAVGDKTAGAIQSGGLPRRAGKMVVVDIDHPDVLSFIRWKGEEQYKAAALITGARVMRSYLNAVMASMEKGEDDQKFDPQHNAALKQAVEKARRAMIPSAAIERVISYAKQGFKELHIPIYSAEKDSEVFFTVGAHQGRQGVRVTNRFMQAAEDNHRFALRKRTDGTVSKQEEAGTILDELAHAVWAAGEPTIHFADAIASGHTCPESGPIRASTPASEYLFIDDTACPLACINLLALANAKGHLDITLFNHAVRITTILLDISVSIAQYPSREMARRTLDTRPLGLGFANFAGLLLRLGVAYDSNEARATAAAIAGLMTAEANVASTELARELGAFPDFQKNRMSYLKIVSLRRELLRTTIDERPFSFDALPQPELLDALKRASEMAQIKTELYGARNAQLTSVPPTSTIARVMDCETLGLAPVATPVRHAMQLDGTMGKSLSANAVYGLQTLGYEAETIEAMAKYACGHASLVGSPAIPHEALQARGFGEKQIAAIETALAYASDIHAAFDPWVLDERFCRDTLKLTDEQMHDATFKLLAHLGFGAKEIAEANAYACGAGRLEDAPQLKPEHRAVFLTALRSHDGGAGVSAETQIALMAAVQPFLTGGIAHTVTLEKDATTDSCREMILKAWHAGLKSLSLYRNASALYEDTVMAALDDEQPEPQTQTETKAPQESMLVFREARASMPSSISEVAAELARRFIGARRELPLRRQGFTQEAVIGGQKLYLRTGEYEDKQLGEIFLDMPGERETYRALIQQFARAISLALQYGVPLSAFVEAFARGHFSPSGPVESSELLDEASSVLDYVFRELEASYAKRTVPDNVVRLSA